VNGLERDGYVRRRAHPDDGRAVMVVATPKAERALAAGRQRRIELLQAIFRDLSESEWETLDRAAALIERGVRGASDLD
jgi:DNA-binding MarR family transcriptional regulator